MDAGAQAHLSLKRRSIDSLRRLAIRLAIERSSSPASYRCAYSASLWQDALQVSVIFDVGMYKRLNNHRRPQFRKVCHLGCPRTGMAPRVLTPRVAIASRGPDFGGTRLAVCESGGEYPSGGGDHPTRLPESGAVLPSWENRPPDSGVKTPDSGVNHPGGTPDSGARDGSFFPDSGVLFPDSGARALAAACWQLRRTCSLAILTRWRPVPS